jgi:hypothetical protein
MPFLENNVLKGQERPYLGISQQCDLERYSLGTVCQNTVHAKLCEYPPLLVCLPNNSCKSYTSKQNITCFAHKKTIKEVSDSKSSSTFVSSNDITTRSDWTYCIFCKKKSYKKKTINSTKLYHKTE